MVDVIRVGLIGYNEGNGHPFSFSAIINGYDPEMMKTCPYQTITNYLANKSTDDFGVGSMKVTHIWCPDRAMSELVASCTYIPNIVSEYCELVGRVDAVIIARDDYKVHYEISRLFLENDIPVFIDKPLCADLEELKFFTPYLKSGKLMSCSGLRYLPALVEYFSDTNSKEDVLWSHNVSIVDWFKYGVHVLESTISVIGADVEWVQNSGEDGNDIVRIQNKSKKFSIIQVNTATGFALRSTIFTKSGNHLDVRYDDNFTCFKTLLVQFETQIITGVPAIDPEETATIIKALYAAQVSKLEHGRKVYLKELYA
jgi:hypothetical protein